MPVFVPVCVCVCVVCVCVCLCVNESCASEGQIAVCLCVEQRRTTNHQQCGGFSLLPHTHTHTYGTTSTTSVVSLSIFTAGWFTTTWTMVEHAAIFGAIFFTSVCWATEFRSTSSLFFCAVVDTVALNRWRAAEGWMDSRFSYLFPLKLLLPTVPNRRFAFLIPNPVFVFFWSRCGFHEMWGRNSSSTIL